MHAESSRFVLIVTLSIVCLLTLGASVRAEQVQLAWNDPNNSSPEVGGYNLYYWQTNWNAPASVDVEKQTTYTLTSLEAGQTYHFAVTAYDYNGDRESAYSNVVSKTIPGRTNAPITIEAESMALTGYRVESNKDASSGQLISRRRASEEPPGLAVATFPGAAGTYDVVVSYFDEKDGRSELAFAVNGVVLDTWWADEDLPSAGTSAVTLAYRIVAQGVALAPGDVIMLKGTENRGEYARVDKIEFIP